MTALVGPGPPQFAGYVARGLRLRLGIIERVAGQQASPSISAVIEWVDGGGSSRVMGVPDRHFKGTAPGAVWTR